MFYIGEQRKASSILADQKKNIKQKDKVAVLKEMVGLVWRMRDALYQGDLHAFGKILHENWIFKRQLSSKISNQSIDDLYQKGIDSGAVGGKLLGAGGGGFLLFYCEEQNHKKLRNTMSSLKELNFKLENEGSKLIYIGDEYEEH